MPCGQPRVCTYGTRWCAHGAHCMRTACTLSVRLPSQLAYMPHAALCCLLAPAKPARQDTRCGCVQSQAATAGGALLGPRPPANACLCEALGRQARGSSDFCAVLLKNNTAGLATVDRASKRQQRSRTSAGAAGRGVSIRCRSCSTGRLILIGEVQQAARRRKRATSCRLAAVLRLAQLPSTGTGFVKGC